MRAAPRGRGLGCDSVSSESAWGNQVQAAVGLDRMTARFGLATSVPTVRAKLIGKRDRGLGQAPTIPGALLSAERAAAVGMSARLGHRRAGALDPPPG